MIIAQIDGHAEQVSYLICMMNYTRNVTLHSIQGLNQRQLDALLDANSNTIGSLLLHIAAIEYAYFVNTFEGRELSGDERTQWGAALRLGEEARETIRGNDLGYYIQTLSEVRSNTLARFKDASDEWLHAIDEYNEGTPINRFFMVSCR